MNMKKTMLIAFLAATAVVATSEKDAQDASAELKKIEEHMRKTFAQMCDMAKNGQYAEHVGSKLRVTDCGDVVNHATHEIMSRVVKFKDDTKSSALFDDLRDNVVAKWRGRYNVDDVENGSLYLQVFILHQNPKYTEEMDKLLKATAMKVNQVPGDVVPPTFTVYHEGDEEGEQIREMPDGTQPLDEAQLAEEL